MALIDFGLVASIKQSDMDTMVSALIHLANRDYPNLVDDFIALGVLPENCDRPKVVPLMDKALTPYVKGGGAKKYEEELRKQYGLDGSLTGTAGGFQAMTQDALTVLNDIPFSIPPYFALLGRAIVTLEGVALTGDPNYGIIMESYPFVARKLLREDRPEIQRALQEVLYSQDGLQANRLSVLLNSALGVVAKRSDAFVDLDSVPDEAVGLGTSLKFLLGRQSNSLRNLLIDEAVTALDILMRQGSRKAYAQVFNNLPRPPFIGRFLPQPDEVRIPFLIPRASFAAAALEYNRPAKAGEGGVIRSSLPTPADLRNGATPVFLTPKQLIEAAAPKLSREEELYALSLTDLAVQTLGEDAGVVVNGNALLDPRATVRFLLSIAGSGQLKLPGGVSSLLSPSQLQAISKRIEPLVAQSNQNRESAADNGIDEVASVLASLAPEEEAVLEETSNAIVSRLIGKVVDRLQVLV